MSDIMTKGGLAAAHIENLITHEQVYCMFNPFEYTITKRNTWTNKDQMGVNLPRVEFKQGGAATLQLRLYFDSQREKKDVRLFTNPLWKMMLVDQGTKNNDTNKSQPPAVAFVWGRLYFKAVITNIQQKFVLFDENGTPLRCEANITLQQYIDESETGNQVPGMSADGTLAGDTTFIQGSRLDNILEKGQPNPRAIAEKNNIDNPLSIPPGTQLKTK